MKDQTTLEYVKEMRARFPHITPIIGDFREVEENGGDSFTAIRDTATYLRVADALIPARYADADATHPQVLEWVDAMVDAAKPDRYSGVPKVTGGPSLRLMGPTGTGKTYQMYGALRRLSVLGVGPVPVAASITDIIAQMRPRPGVDSEAVFKRYAEASLAYIDDLGVAKMTEWVEEVLYRLVNARYNESLPTLFSSNVTAKQVSERLGDRVASRLNEMTARVVIDGQDRRRGGGAAAA